MSNRKSVSLIVLTAFGLALGVILMSGRTARASDQVRASTAVRVQHAVPAQGLEVIGTFVAPNQATLSFRASGRIEEIRIQEGGQVKKGDILAVLDTAVAQLSVQQAQAALAGAQARLAQTKNSATNADTAAAQAAVDAALRSYEKVRAGPTANDIAPLKAQVDNAKAALDQAQSAYDRVGGASNPYIGLLPQSVQLQTATNNYSAAIAAYNNARTHPTAAELAGAWAQVQQAQDALSRLQPNSDSVAAAQAAVDQAQAALALAQQQITDASLVAPSDGTVVWLGPHVGEMATPGGPILILADLTHMQLQAGVDESSLAMVRVGQTVSIVPEAFKDKAISGQVSRIGWLATTTAGVINVPLTIDVNPSDVPLRPGLSATAEIQTSQQ